jgi:prolyl 4-hydroxylase
MASIVDDANALAASGRGFDGLTQLLAAAKKGDAVATMEAAIWHLSGQWVPRDLPAARILIRRAVALGHVDGALMEVALTANGSGGTADWPAALLLLQTAAAKDPLAQRQIELLTAMDLDASGAPKSVTTPERLSTKPHVVRFRQFLSAHECAHVAAAAHDDLEPSHVIDPVTGILREHPIRTSDGALIGPAREDLVIRAINRRIAMISDTQIDQGEALSVLRYRAGQQFRLHHDAISGAGNQRIKTVLLYLNDNFQGGETYFPHQALTIKPAAGDAILFSNTFGDGCADPAANHAGLPVTGGVKWLATRWIRARAFDVWSGPESV